MLRAFFGFFGLKEDMIEEMRSTRSSKTMAKDWEGIPGQDYVYKLSEGNYSNFLKSHESALIMFYAPWCGHCKVIKPEFAMAAMNLARSNVPAALASCDCDESPKMVERFQLSGYPTVMYFRNGRPQGEYNQGRKAMDIIKFMTSQAKTRDEF